jgi:hypothetical protein
MLILFLILMTILVGLWVMIPLFTSLKAEPASAAGPMPELYLAKERAYDSIRDLEFDYHSGKLSESDYLEIKEGLQREALEAMKNLESQEGQESPRPSAGSEEE